MKTKLQHATLAASAVLTMMVLFAGCKEKASMPDTDRSSATVPDADNSGKNVRDRNDATLTPGDQGTSAADQEVTQKVRKALVNDTTGYSVTAKNVKIITSGGKVTLRGPVKTDAEKMGIVAIAKNVAGDGNVDDQLEIKANP